MIDQRAVKRDCHALVDAMVQESKSGEDDAMVDRCVDRIMEMLTTVQIEYESGAAGVRALLRSQLAYDNPGGAHKIIDSAVDDHIPNRPVIIATVVALAAFAAVGLGSHYRMIGRVLFYLIAGIGITAVVFIALMMWAGWRFYKNNPHFIEASNLFDRVTALTLEKQPTLALNPYRELRELAQAHPTEAHLLWLFQLRAVTELGKAMGSEDEANAIDLLADVVAVLDQRPPDAVCFNAALALSALISPLPRHDAETALNHLRMLVATHPANQGIYDTAINRSRDRTES